MIVGVPKEIKNDEYRVGLRPVGAELLTQDGHEVLIVHGAGDGFVPARFSEELYEAAPEPKKLLLVNGATHNNSMRVGSTEYLQAMRELFGIERLALATEVKSGDVLSLSLAD